MSSTVQHEYPTGSEPGPERKNAERMGDCERAALLTDAVRICSSAATSGAALDAIFELLKTAYDIEAISLELTVDSVTRHQPHGRIGSAARESLSEVRSFALDVPQFTEVSGRILFVSSRDRMPPDDLLQSITSILALRIREETMQRELDEAEARSRKRIGEVAAIYEIGQAIDEMDTPKMLARITERAALLMDAQSCTLALIDEDTGRLRVEAGFGLAADTFGADQAVEEGLAGRVIATGKAVMLAGGASHLPIEGVHARVMNRLDLGSAMLVPMKSHHGGVIGVMSMCRLRPQSDFRDSDLKLFSVLTTQASLALANKRLFDDANRRAAELQKVTELSRSLTTINLDELLDRVADDICGVVGFARCCIYMRDVTRGLFLARSWRGYSDAMARNPIREREGAVGAIAQNKALSLFEAACPPASADKHDRVYLQMRGFARSLGTDSFLGVPILTSKSDCVGVVIADNRGLRNAISPEEVRLLAAFVSHAGIAIDNARLHEKAQRLTDYTDNVLQSIADGIISTDSRGHIARWNRAAAAIMKQQPSFFRNVDVKTVVEQMGLSSSDRDQILRLIERVPDTGERIHLRNLTMYPSTQQPMTLNLKLSRLGGAGRERAGVVLSMEDVTQQAQLQREMERIRRLADIGQLAAKMAHEVRNALSPIKAAAQLLRFEREQQSASTEWSDMIIAEVDDLAHLTNAMLDFARPTSVFPRPVQLREFLSGAITSLTSFLSEHAVTVNIDIAQDLPEIWIDAVQMGQAVRNIAMNAAQSMPEGGALRIAARYDADSHTFSVEFHDTGTGISEDDLDRIFRPFVTTRPKGTGLGLPIVQKIIDQHGGSVEVRSKVGEGTCFTIALPLRPSAERGDMGADEAPLISGRHLGQFPDN